MWRFLAPLVFLGACTAVAGLDGLDFSTGGGGSGGAAGGSGGAGGGTGGDLPTLFRDSDAADFQAGQATGAVLEDDHVKLSAANDGSFRSRVFDAQRDVRIVRVGWVPGAPYGRALPDGAAAEVGYPEGGANMASAALHFHFDELMTPVSTGDTLQDSSMFGDDAAALGSPQVIDGVFGKAVDLPDLSRIRVIVQSGSQLQFGEDSYSWVYWLRTTEDCPNTNAPFGNRVHLGLEQDGGTHLWLGCTNAAGWCSNLDGGGRAGGVISPASGESITFCGLSTINDGSWHQVALVKSGHQPATAMLYVDGKLEDARTQELFGPITFDITTDFIIGALTTEEDQNGFASDVAIDEVAILRAAWSADQVADAYRRFVTNASLRVRTCSEPDCSDDPPFSNAFVDDGPDAPVSHNMPPSAAGRYLQYEASFSRQDVTVDVTLHEVSLEVIED